MSYFDDFTTSNYQDDNNGYLQDYRKQKLLELFKKQTQENPAIQSPEPMKQENPNMGIQSMVNSPDGQSSQNGTLGKAGAGSSGIEPISSAPSGRLIAPISWLQGAAQLSQAADPNKAGGAMGGKSGGSSGMMSGLMQMAPSFFA